MLELLPRVTVERNLTTILALHDLNLAARYAGHFIVLHRGTVYAAGPAAAVLTPDMLREVYGVKATVSVNGLGLPQITPLGSIRSTSATAPVLVG